MGITFSCDLCGKRYNVDASFAGKRVKCKECGGLMTIPGPASTERSPAGAAPRRTKADAPEAGVFDELLDDPYGLADGGASAKKGIDGAPLPRVGAGRRSGAVGSASGVPPWAWLAGGAAALLMLVLFVFGMRHARSRAVRPVEPGAPGAEEEVATTPPVGGGAIERKPGAAAGRFKRDDTSAAVSRTSWRVAADPAAEAPVFPEGAKLSIPVPKSFSSDDVLFPTTPSPFVVLGGNATADQFREVWDLRSATRVGRLSGHIEVARPMALSPDGAYMAVHTNPVPRTTDVWRVADARRIARIEDGEQIPDVLNFVGPGDGRIIIGTSYAKAFQVWDFLKGEQVLKIETPGGFDRDSVAFSSGRRYMALTLSQKNKVMVYDLTNGRLAGEIELEEDGSSKLDCKGMAFSPDGTALAGLFTSSAAAHLICWDATSGKLASDFRAEGPDPYGKSYSYEGQAVQWLPDGSGWLIYDQSLVERQSGQVVWSIPFDPVRYQEHGPRKVLDAGRMVAVGKARDRKVLQLVALPRDKVQAALALAKSGGSAVDATLPPVTAADLGAAKQVEASSAPVAWTALPPAAPAAKAPAGRPIGLRVGALDILGLLVSGPESPQAFVVSSPGARLAATKGRQSGQARTVDRYDLKSGQPVGRFEIPSVSTPIAVSPGASHILLTHSGGPDRLDIHAAKGEHVVGWRPYDKESGDDRNVIWADFLDPKRVLTVNQAGTLILWTFPDLKAVYVAPRAMEGPPILGPGRKSLAVLHGGALRILDPTTGAPRGDAAATGHPSSSAGLKAAAFDLEGRELAAVLDGTIVRWDLNTGRVLGETPSPAPKAASLESGANRHVLIDGKIVFDLERKRVVWFYEGGSTPPPDSAACTATPPAPSRAWRRSRRPNSPTPG